jgi:hypothetical protein
MKFKTIELLLKLSYLLAVCRHAGVMAISLPHDLVGDELRVAVDVKPLDPELSGNAQAVDEGLIFHHIVCRVEIQLNYVDELISLGGDQNDASPHPIEGPHGNPSRGEAVPDNFPSLCDVSTRTR